MWQKGWHLDDLFTLPTFCACGMTYCPVLTTVSRCPLFRVSHLPTRREFKQTAELKDKLLERKLQKYKASTWKMIGVDSWQFGKSVIYLFRGVKLDTGVFIQFFNDFQVQMSCDTMPNSERDILIQDILESWSSWWSRRTAPATTRTAASRALRWKRNWTLYPAPGWDFDYDEIKYV